MDKDSVGKMVADKILDVLTDPTPPCKATGMHMVDLVTHRCDFCHKEFPVEENTHKTE
jgi:hypothetical protein